jgi:hypothetical protein
LASKLHDGTVGDRLTLGVPTMTAGKPRSTAFRSTAALGLAAGVLASAACGGGGDVTATSPLCTADPGPAPLRRMTRFEYGRTLADLTGVDASIGASLPPDEESLGYDDIADAYSVSSLHASRYLEAAEQAASTLIADTARLAAFGGCDPTAGDDTCVAAFVAGFGRRAWRRPLDDDEGQAMHNLYTATADPTPADGVSAVVAAMLEAPQFLYRPEPAAPGATTAAPLDSYALATRLSYLLTGAGPDETLLAAADAGKLATEAGLLAEADRLLTNDRATELFVHFATAWWELESVPDLEKDRNLYRAWTDDTAPALAEETQLFLTDFWHGTPTLSALLTTPATFVDASLASFYGLPAPASDGFQRVALDPARGSGMLTQGSFLAVHAKADQTSPTLRGKFVRAQLFCDPPPPPPASVVVRPPAVDPRLSTRQRFAQHTADPFCANCHTLMDPIGFSFEHYDAAGRWRDTDGDMPVDATGMLTKTDVDGALDGVPSLAARLVASAEVRSCAATQWFRYAFGRAEQTAGDTCTIAALASALAGPNGDFRKMVRQTVRTAQFRNLPPQAQP